MQDLQRPALLEQMRSIRLGVHLVLKTAEPYQTVVACNAVESMATKSVLSYVPEELARALTFGHRVDRSRGQ